MARWHSETLSIEITYTTNGEVVNRVTGAREGGMHDTKAVLIAYLEQFCGVKVQPVDKAELRKDIDAAIDKHLGYDREGN